MMAVPYNRPANIQQLYAASAPVPAAVPEVKSSAAEPVASAAGSDTIAAAESVTVRINGMRFEPANITIKPGTTVTWVQDSTMPHLISGKTSGLRSNTLNRGQQYSYTFNQAGRFDYVCGLHPSMKGSIVSRKPRLAAERSVMPET
jgi:plastocyanin